MKLARYMGGGEVAIVSEPEPSCPPGGLLVRTEASGLCSGELMDWYMDAKIPHVLGHEVCGVVIESEDDRFPVGARVAPHHHAPCMKCDLCRRGAYVHCEQWKRTKLVPGGMAEFFAVAHENLTDTIRIGEPLEDTMGNMLDTSGVRPQDAALVEPIACVCKSTTRAPLKTTHRTAVIGLGFMGLVHLLLLKSEEGSGGKVLGYDLNANRVEWARSLGFEAHHPDEAKDADEIYVCPGSADALEMALKLARPDSNIILFSPLPPPGDMTLPLNRLYFGDVNLITSYSCGPVHTLMAYEHLAKGVVRAEQVVSDFITLDDLPRAYKAMKAGEILKPMVLFEEANA